MTITEIINNSIPISKYNAVTVYCLPLVPIRPKFFNLYGFRNSFIDPETFNVHVRTFVEVPEEKLPIPAQKAIVAMNIENGTKDNLARYEHIFNIQEMYYDDVYKMLEGKYSKISKQTKDVIKLYAKEYHWVTTVIDGTTKTVFSPPVIAILKNDTQSAGSKVLVKQMAEELSIRTGINSEFFLRPDVELMSTFDSLKLLVGMF